MFTNSWGGADSAAAANMCQCVSQLALLVTGVHRVVRVESRLPPNVACLLIVKGFDRRFAVLWVALLLDMCLLYSSSWWVAHRSKVCPIGDWALLWVTYQT